MLTYSDVALRAGSSQPALELELEDVTEEGQRMLMLTYALLAADMLYLTTLRAGTSQPALELELEDVTEEGQERRETLEGQGNPDASDSQVLNLLALLVQKYKFGERR